MPASTDVIRDILRDNHGGELPDGIAEAFVEWATSEQLSFWR